MMLRAGPRSTSAPPVLLTTATALALAGVCAVSFFGDRSAPDAADRPDECIWRMTQSSQQGDVDVYLACFAGPFYDRLLAQAQQQRARFADRLQAGVAELTGLSVLERRFPAPDRAELLVERVYPRYNEHQRFHLRRDGALWKIDRLGTIQRRVPEVAYGTPVFPEASSGGPDLERQQGFAGSSKP